MPFCVNSSQLFCTFPRPRNISTTPTKEALHAHVKAQGRTAPIYQVTAEELHEDGSTHFHVLLVYTNRKKVTRADYFDFDGWHCNIQACRNLQATVDYVKKDGNFIEEGELPVDQRRNELPLVANYRHKADWVQACFLNKVPGYYCEELWRLKHQVDKRTIVAEEYQPPAAATMWQVLRELTLEWDDRTVILIGPSGCGKTTWAMAKCPKPALVVTHADDLKGIDATIKCIIFDDVDFKHYPRTGQIHLVDQFLDRSIHVRYGTARIPAGVKRVFTANIEPVDINDEAIRRRCRVIRISDPLNLIN